MTTGKTPNSDLKAGHTVHVQAARSQQEAPAARPGVATLHTRPAHGIPCPVRIEPGTL